MDVLTLNVQRPSTERAEELHAWLALRSEQVLVLTEVGPGGGSARLGALLRRDGHQVLGLGANLHDLGVLIVGRGVPLTPDAVARPRVLPGRVESVVVGAGPQAIRLAGVYGAASDPFRYGSAQQRERKRSWLAAFDDWVATWLGDTPTRAALVGDLNVADPLASAGARYVLAEELECYARLHDHGLSDAWRLKHPDSTEVSWVGAAGSGVRYDHAFVTDDLAVAACDLVPEPLERALTDHAALTLRVN